MNINSIIMINKGQYDVSNGRFDYRYIVHRVMNKTADVGTAWFLDGERIGSDRHARYPLDLLKEQIKGARFTPDDQRN